MRDDFSGDGDALYHELLACPGSRRILIVPNAVWCRMPVNERRARYRDRPTGIARLRDAGREVLAAAAAFGCILSPFVLLYVRLSTM